MLQQDRWKNRRAMAWIALLAGLAFPLILFYTESNQLGAIAGAFYLFVTSVVGSYIGFATFDDKWQVVAKKDKTTQESLSSDGFPPEPK